MADIVKEFERRASDIDMEVDEKVKFRKYMKDLRSLDRKATVWAILHVLAQIIFFWSILALAVSSSQDIVMSKLPAGAKGYYQMTIDFFGYFDDKTSFFIPYAFILMMVFGTFRGNAERARTKMVAYAISLITFAEQKHLLGQMKTYVDNKVAQSKGGGGSGRSSRSHHDSYDPSPSY
jgi:hypothetical protein